MRRSRRVIALAAIVVLLIGAAPVLPADAAVRCPALTNVPDANPMTSATMAFSGAKRDGTRVAGATFAASTLADLVVRISWTEILSGQVQRLELTAPDGSVYQRTMATLQKARPRQIAPVVVNTRVPVAGSWITQHALYGKWCARVYLDKDPDPVVQRPFYLTGP